MLLSDGTHAVLEAGAEPERELLHAAIGSEGRGPIYQSADGTRRRRPGPRRSARSSPGSGSGPSAGAPPPRTTPRGRAVATTAAIWSVAGVLALGGAGLRAAAHGTAAPGDAERGRAKVSVRRAGAADRLWLAGVPHAAGPGRSEGAASGLDGARHAGRRSATPRRSFTADRRRRRPLGLDHQLRPLPVARSARRRGDGAGVHRRDLRRRGIPPHLRRQAAARRAVARSRGGGAVHRRGQARLDAGPLQRHPGVRLRQGRRRVLPGAGVHPRARHGARHHPLAGAAGSTPPRSPPCSTSRRRPCWRWSTPTRSWATAAGRWGSSTATSRPATSSCRPGAR